MNAGKLRQWELLEDDDPAAGLLNLFDVWMVFAIALLLALASYYQLPQLSARSAAEAQKSLEAIERENVRLEQLQLSGEQLGGKGERLGMAYRLKSGEIVHVPERAASGQQTD